MAKELRVTKDLQTESKRRLSCQKCFKNTLTLQLLSGLYINEYTKDLSEVVLCETAKWIVINVCRMS